MVSVAMFLSPPSQRGGGLEEKLRDDAIVVDSMEGQPGAVVLPRTHHMVTKFAAMICGKKGDPSSTFGPEALWFFCWSSTPIEGQVVRPRTSSGCQRVDLYAEVELSSILLSGLGGDTLSLPASGGGGTEVIDCFSPFLSGCFL
jgi:hypothetical protein